jgi:peptidoglycan/xylan/chitin deacetylase (PgdA/CDA1 family)
MAFSSPPERTTGLPRRAVLGAAAGVLAAPAQAQGGTLYLTIDTGWMSEANLIAETLAARQVRATLFLADERTFRGDTCLADSWGDFWRARVAEGHAFGSHTLRHWYFRGDPDAARVTFQSFDRRQTTTLDQAAMCAELRAPEARLRAMTGRGFDPVWRAPGGQLTRNAEKFATACGFRHVGWSPAGFLGDELPSDRYPNQALLARALANLRHGDTMMLHWGIRSRAEKFAPMLAPLLDGLLAKGFRFQTLAGNAA